MLIENNCGGWERAGSGLVISHGGAFRGLSEFYAKIGFVVMAGTVSCWQDLQAQIFK